MGNCIELNWEKKYFLLIAQAFLMSFRMEVNFSKKNIKDEENKLASSIFDLITECCLTFSFFIYIIEKSKVKNSKKKKDSNTDTNLPQICLNKIIVKKYDIYILPKSSLNNIFLILFLIAITALFKFCFSIFNYYVCLKVLKNYETFLDTFFSAFLIVNTFILAIIKINVTKKKFYLHNIIAIINILLITIIIVLIYYNIYYNNNEIHLKFTDFIYSSFFCWLSIFLFFMDLLIYKILTEKYYVMIYSLNAIEGMYITIYTIIFYFIVIKRDEKKKNKDPFEFNKYFLILSCIMQIIINLLIKFIVYTYDEMHSTIPYFLQIFIDTIKSIIESKNDKKTLNFI